jgi:carbon storage regulator
LTFVPLNDIHIYINLKHKEVVMLVLSRKPCERIRIGDSVVVTVVRIEGNSVRLGIEAPEEVSVYREELLHKRGGSAPPRGFVRKPAYTGPAPISAQKTV